MGKKNDRIFEKAWVCGEPQEGREAYEGIGY